jgi:predicted nucleic acid-binding protein
MKLEEVPGGTPIFVDANIFIYHYIRVRTIPSAVVRASEAIRVQDGLMTNDSVAVALMRKLRLTAIATADADFDHLSALRVYQPGDIS